MFEITNPTPAKLVNYNPRAEKHGKVKRPAPRWAARRGCD